MCAQKLTQASLICRTGPTTKKWKKENVKSKKTGYAQKYRQTVRGFRAVSPERAYSSCKECQSEKSGYTVRGTVG